jgi:BMFP domain-containing protein YqiC
MNKSTLDELAGKLADAIPSELVPGDLHELREDLRKNFRGLLTASLDRMDLVTREEFDVQRKVLERTREKLDRLEKQLAALQDQQSSSGDNN